jgi:DNA-binding transcriptional LysR family regulator
MPMNARQLEAFRAVVEDGTVSGAARRLRVSQPAVSKLIAALERGTGLQLFRRERQRLVATAEASLLYEETDRLFMGIERIALAASEIRSLRAGKLTVVGLPALGLRVLPRLIARFVADKPEANVTLQVQPSPRVIDWVTAQQVDLGISILPVDHPAVRVEPLASVAAVCVLPRGHRLARRKLIRPADLRGEMFVSLASDDRARHMIDRAFDAVGVARQLRLETHLSELACRLVESGAGVSIVDPFTAVEFAEDGLVMRPFQPRIQFQIHLLFPAFRPRSLLLDGFVQALRDEIGRLKGRMAEAPAAEHLPRAHA